MTTELIAKLEAATKGSDDLSRAVGVELGKISGSPAVYGPYGVEIIASRESCGRFTQTVDDALILVSGPYTAIDLQFRDEGSWYVAVSVGRKSHYAKNGSLPLAICIAALKARVTQK